MSSSRIKILPDDVVNRISAGEVVERPASVVKELVENAIDAGSGSVRVEIADGGCALIRVTDDGEGMSPEEALLAFSRHATSKLSTEQDLLSLHTLGFRGEALPSIASVSKIRLVTLRKGAPAGFEVRLEGGKVIKEMEIGAPGGTSVEVEDLFFNTPPRKKFLKTPATEMSHISQFILQHALAFPGIHFQLYLFGKKGKRELYNLTPVKNLGERILQVFGEPFFSQLLPVGEERHDIRLEGYISKPLFTRGERSQQELFVNGRAVKHPGTSHALYEAYETLLSRGRHPISFLFLRLDPSLVDINVHPSKREVRFRETKAVHDFVRTALRRSLMGGRRQTPLPEAPEKDLPERGKQKETPLFEKGPADSPSPGTRVREATEYYLRREWPSSGNRRAGEGAPPFERDWIRLPEEHPRLLGDRWDPLGQFQNTFILAILDGDLFIVDQHTAHERVLFEQILKRVVRGRPEVQRLLIPVTQDLPISEFLLLKEHFEELYEMGFEFEAFGERAVLLRSLPASARPGDIQQLILDLVDDLQSRESIKSPDTRRNKIVSTLACHSAVRAHRPLKKEEMRTLLIDLQKTDLPYTCPHGRPTLARIEGKWVERFFWRA